MSLGNFGVVMNLIDGFVATEFNNVRNHQGVAIFPFLIHKVCSQANLEFTSNLRVTAPRFFDGALDVDVEANAVRLFGFVVDNTEAADNALAIYATNTVVEGTTDIELYLEIPASSMLAIVIPGGLALAAFSWSATDAGNAAMEAGTLAAANSLKTMFVYSE